MADDLRETMVQAAAARYGQEHYRGLLFWHGMRRFWPGLLLLVLGAGCIALGWWVKPSAGAFATNALPWLLWILGGVVTLVCTWLLIRRARSPYRRRRF